MPPTEVAERLPSCEGPRTTAESRRPLRIILTVDPYIPVPPRLYGGIERIVDALVRGLLAKGHDISLLAHPESQTAGKLIAYGREPHVGWRCRATELWQVGKTLWEHRKEFDVVHSFGRLRALLPVLAYRALPKIQSYQRPVPWDGVRQALRLAGNSLQFTACSRSMFAARENQGTLLGRWHAIHNGVEVERYQFVPTVSADAPLVFLGRLEPIKGVHHALAIAKAAGRRLVIAGNRVETGEAAGYFEREIAPHLDGQQIEYVGPLDDAQKNSILGSSAALLMPIEWDEPFGIVMAEAMACGTPVIGFPRGSVPEVIRPGVTGFLVRNVEEAAGAVARLDEIDRRAVWQDCQIRFSLAAITNAYENVYYDVVA